MLILNNIKVNIKVYIFIIKLTLILLMLKKEGNRGNG